MRPNVPRAKLLELIASLPPCLSGMEACSGAHHWARQFAQSRSNHNKAHLRLGQQARAHLRICICYARLRDHAPYDEAARLSRKAGRQSFALQA